MVADENGPGSDRGAKLRELIKGVDAYSEHERDEIAARITSDKTLPDDIKSIVLMIVERPSLSPPSIPPETAPSLSQASPTIPQ